jgi:hypothetical protein
MARDGRERQGPPDLDRSAIVSDWILSNTIIRAHPRINPEATMSTENPEKPEAAESGINEERKRLNRNTAKKLNLMRGDHRITQDALSIAIRTRTGVEISTNRLSRYERNINLASPAEIWALAKYYGADFDWLCDPNNSDGVMEKAPAESGDFAFLMRLVAELGGPAEAVRLIVSKLGAGAGERPPAPRAINPDQVVKPPPGRPRKPKGGDNPG